MYHQGFANIFWIPLAMKIGRRPVLLITTLFVLASMVWQAEFDGSAQWYLSCALNGVGTSAYQAVIQLSIFDMFFVHQRSTSLSFYLFGQQLGSMSVSLVIWPKGNNHVLTFLQSWAYHWRRHRRHPRLAMVWLGCSHYRSRHISHHTLWLRGDHVSTLPL